MCGTPHYTLYRSSSEHIEFHRINRKRIMLTDDAHYKLLKQLELKSDSSQRDLSDAMGISLGKVNYYLQALISTGIIKATNFSRSSNKRGYLYVLTPSGIEAKARVTRSFLDRKVKEYELLRGQIKELRREAGAEHQQ